VIAASNSPSPELIGYPPPTRSEIRNYWVAVAAAWSGTLVWLLALSQAQGRFRLFSLIETEGLGVLLQGGAWSSLGLAGTLIARVLVATAVVGAVVWKWPRATRSIWPIASLSLGWLGLIVLLWFAGARFGEGLNQRTDTFYLGILGTILALGAGLFWATAMDPEWRDEPHWLKRAPMFAGIVFAVLFTWLSISRHQSYNSHLHDLGLSDQMLWSLTHGYGYRVTTWQDEHYNLRPFEYNFAAEHITPILVILAPGRLIIEGAEWLLTCQALALGGAGWLMGLWAARRTQSTLFGAAMAAGWVLHPLVQQTAIKDFHTDAMAPVALAWALLSMDPLEEPDRFAPRRWGQWFGALLLFLMTKEDASLQLVGFGLFLMARLRWRTAVGVLGLGIAYYVAVVGVVTPIVRRGEPLRHLYRYTTLHGGTEPRSLGAMVRFVLLNPLSVWREVANIDRVASLVTLGMSVVLVPLLDPRCWLLIGIPMSAALLSNWYVQFRLELHYGLSSALWCHVACVFVVDAAMRWARQRDTEAGWIRPDAPKRRRTAERLVHGAAIAIILAGATASYFNGRFPGSRAFQWSDHSRLPRHVSVERIFAMLPTDAPISATGALGAHLTGRASIFYFPDIPIEAEWIVVDTVDDDGFRRGGHYRDIARDLLRSGEWGVVNVEGFDAAMPDGFLLMRRGHPTDRNAAAIEELDAGVTGD